MKRKLRSPLQSYDQEIESLLSNKEIFDKLDFGFRDAFKDSNEYYHTLYKTTNLITKEVYVGITSNKDIKYSAYIGCGIKNKVSPCQNKINGQSKFVRSVKKYGAENFIRQNLLFFSNRQDLCKAEIIIVDKNFVSDDRTLNVCLGGNYPPKLVGKENGNYGNKWTNKQKQDASVLLRKMGHAKGALNGNARQCIVVNIFNLEATPFTTRSQAAEFINVKIGTLTHYKHIIDKSPLFRKKYILLSKDCYEEIIKDKEEFQKLIKFYHK